MATYVLIHGAGDVGWAWHLVEAELRALGHDVVAPDLPCDDESAGLMQYADSVVEAIGDRTDLVVVGHSFGGYTAPIVCGRIPADLLVLVAGMVPSPGESANEMFTNTGYQQEPLDDDSEFALFLHDVDPDLAAEALAKGRDQASAPMDEPWPLEAWPDVPTRFLLCRDDRLFPAGFMRRVVGERLGITPDEIDGSHCAGLSRPEELAGRLEVYRKNLGGGDAP